MTSPIITGDLGVDLFFVLSGFLIAYIIFKEMDKNDGEISIFDFYRSRFLRLWPALAYLVFTTIIGTYVFGGEPDFL